jgi:hypothetical protein
LRLQVRIVRERGTGEGACNKEAAQGRSLQNNVFTTACACRCALCVSAAPAKVLAMKKLRKAEAFRTMYLLLLAPAGAHCA